jgi:hypothetical protein
MTFLILAIRSGSGPAAIGIFDYAVAVEFQLAKERGLPRPWRPREDVSLHVKQLHGVACVP